MINRNDNVSIVQQCRLLDLHRSGVYYQAAEESEDNLSLMRLIDEIHLNRPFLGIRRITDALYDMRYRVNRKRVQRLMQKMGIQAIYPKPNTSKRHGKHKIYLCLANC